MLPLLSLAVACSDAQPESGPGSGSAATAVSADVATGGRFAVALQQANADGRERAQEISRLSAAAKGQGLERTLEVYAAIADQARLGRDRYATLAVPPPVAGEMAALVRLLTDQVEALDELGPIAQRGDRAATSSLLARLSSLTTDLQTARTRLDAALRRCGTDCA